MATVKKGGGRGPCGCACSEICVFTEDLHNAALRFMWEPVQEDVGTGTATFELLTQGGYMVLDGSGSATAVAHMPADQESIYVQAEAYPPAGGTEAGVTIRRVDSPDHIAFWWLGGTSYELRQGNTVLAAFTGPGAGDLKLELVTPRAGTTDVNCYVGGALVHTEVGVSFTLPDILNLGMISKGSASFSWFSSSPCPKTCHSTPCDTICEQAFNSLCSEEAANIPSDFDLPLLPVSWEADIEITGTEGSGNCCSRYGGKIAFALGQNVRSLGIGVWTGSCPDTFPASTVCSSCAEMEIWGQHSILQNSVNCTWHGVISSKYPGPDDRPACHAFDENNNHIASWRPPRTPVPPGVFPWWGPGDCTRADGNDAPNTQTHIRWLVNVGVQQVGPGTSPSDFEVGVSLRLENLIPGQESTLAWYTSTPQPLDTVDLVNSPTVLSFFAGALGSSACTIPSTITLIPNGSRAVAGEVTQCWDVDVCDPPLDPVSQAIYVMTASFEDPDGRIFTEDVTMTAFFNEATNSWEWNGVGQGFTSPDCGTVPPSTYRIYCQEEGEGEIRRWVISMSNSNGTVTLPMTIDPELGPTWTGTVNNQCPGDDWDSLIDNLHQPVSAWFGNCINTYEPMKLEGNVQYVCFFSPESEQADIVLTAIPYSAVPGTLPGSIMGSVWRGTIPFGTGFHVYVYAISTTGFNLVITHLDGTLLSGGSTTGTYHCGGADGRPVLEDVFIPTGWGNEPDPTGICSGTYGNAEWAFTWDGFKFYGE